MTIVYTVKEIRNNKIKIYTENNNINIYTEPGWKMAIVYTVGEIRKITSKYTQNKVGRLCIC
jgi:hypothetical protein